MKSICLECRKLIEPGDQWCGEECCTAWHWRMYRMGRFEPVPVDAPLHRIEDESWYRKEFG